MYSSLDQRFSRAGFNGVTNDSERTVSWKPNSLDYRITIKNDLYGPPPSALRAKVHPDKRSAAPGSRPAQSATNNGQMTPGKRFTGDFKPHSGPSNRSRGQPTDWSGRHNGEDSSNRGRARMGPIPAPNFGGTMSEEPSSATSDAFRGRHGAPSNPNFASGGSFAPELGGSVRVGRPGAQYGLGRGPYPPSSAPPRRGGGAGIGVTGRLRHANVNPTVGSARYDQPPQSSGKLVRGDRPQYATYGAHGDASWGPAHRFPRSHRSGKGDWFGRPKARGGVGGPQSNGGSGVWMHDDRFPSVHKQSSTAGNRFTKRSMHDRRFDVRGFMSSTATDEYIDDFNPEDLDKYKLEINMDSFTVHSPLLSDPILRTPLSKWGSNELRYSPERDLFALHSPDLELDLDDDAWPLQQPSKKPTRRAPPQLTPRTPSVQNSRRNWPQRDRHVDPRVSDGAYSAIRSKPVVDKTKGNTATGTLMNAASDQASQSTDKTSISPNISSISQTVDDSGLGESVKPLSSTKSYQDLISYDSFALLPRRESDLYRCHSCPDSLQVDRNAHRGFYSGDGYVADNGDEDDEDQANGELLGNPNLTRTRSCCPILRDESLESAPSASPLRRTQSGPNWYQDASFQMKQSERTVVQVANLTDGERSASDDQT